MKTELSVHATSRLDRPTSRTSGWGINQILEPQTANKDGRRDSSQKGSHIIWLAPWWLVAVQVISLKPQLHASMTSLPQDGSVCIQDILVWWSGDENQIRTSSDPRSPDFLIQIPQVDAQVSFLLRSSGASKRLITMFNQISEQPKIDAFH